MAKQRQGNRTGARSQGGGQRPANRAGSAPSGNGQGANNSVTTKEASEVRLTGASITNSGATGAAAKVAATSAAGGPVVSSLRERTGTARPVNRQRYAVKQNWWRKNKALLIAVGSVVVLIAVFFEIASHQNSGTGVGNVDPQVLQEVMGVPTATFDKVGTGNLQNPITALPAGPTLTQNGKPEILYVGAEYCPYCAAERWSMIVALSRFGTWQGLNTTTSSDTDAYPGTNTFTFVNSSFSSKYVTFVSKEIQDRGGNDLQKLSSDENAIFSKYDAPPYVSQNSTGGIPFISFGNQYMALSAGFSPQLLQGLTWSDIAGKLKNPNDPVTQGMIGNANYITAAICKITGNNAGSVCNSQTIQQIEGQLPKQS
jgi:hypothetical protein